MGNGTSIGRVRGLGSSHHGAHHWLLQRFTAIGNLALVIFLVISFVLLTDHEFETLRAWISSPLTAGAFALLIISTFWHARMGLQVLMEDYVQDPANRFAALALLNVAAFGGGAFGLICILRLVMSAQGNAAAEEALSAIQNQMGGR